MFQLPILDNSTKLKIPVKPLIRKKHDIRKRRVLVTTNAIEFGKCLSKSTAPTPQMMPKPNSITSTNLENDGFRESWSALSCGSPKNNTISICYSFCTPTTPIIPMLNLNNPLPKVGCLRTVPPQPFT